MANILQPLPTKAGDVGTLARQLLRLKGPAYPAPDGSLNAADAVALAFALANGRDTNAASLDEAFPISALRLLAEWEAMLGLPDGSARETDERQVALLARWRTRFAGTPNAIVSALTPLNNGFPPTVRETLARESHANPRRVYAFTVRTSVNPTTPAIAPLVAAVAVMKPAHTRAAFTDRAVTVGFFCNDPGSLTNNTVL